MALSFKVTIPQGGLLEKELKGKAGRERTIHLYMMAEIGARALRNLSGAVIGDFRVDDSEPIKNELFEPALSEMENVKVEEFEEVASNKQPTFVAFNKSDLLSM